MFVTNLLKGILNKYMKNFGYFIILTKCLISEYFECEKNNIVFLDMYEILINQNKCKHKYACTSYIIQNAHTKKFGAG